jgi:hypothetical protein
MTRSCFLLLALLCIPAATFAADEFKVFGGPAYRGWSPEDSTLPCIIRVSAPNVYPKRQKPIMVVLQIDVSAGMEGVALQFAKQAARVVVANLQDGDYFGLVSYASAAMPVYSLRPLRRDRNSAGMAIDRLFYGDKRDKEFDRFKDMEVLGRYLFIITDGDPTYGITDPGQLSRQAIALCRQSNVSISTFAYKRERRDFNDELLMDIAYRTNGRYFLQVENDTAKADFVRETERVSSAFAREVSIELSLPDGVTMTYLQGGFLENNRIMLGDMAPRQYRFLVFDLVNRPQRSSDFMVTLNWRPGDAPYQQHSHTFLDIPLSDKPQNYNSETAPFMLILDFQSYLAENANLIVDDRAKFTDLYRHRRWELERLKGPVFSNFFNYMLWVLEENEALISNNAIDSDLMRKRINYLSHRIYYGQGG